MCRQFHCQKIINSIDCGNCNVESIFSHLGWNNPLRYQRVGNIECLLGYQDQGHISAMILWIRTEQQNCFGAILVSFAKLQFL